MARELRESFGFDSLRQDQKASVQAICSPEHCIMVLRTGAGKSVCCQAPCLAAEGMTVVVTPLKAIRDHHISCLEGMHVSTAMSDGDLDAEEKSSVTGRVRSNASYITPESVRVEALTSSISEVYEAGLLQRIVVDEAHCVMEWGESFRCF